MMLKLPSRRGLGSRIKRPVLDPPTKGSVSGVHIFLINLVFTMTKSSYR